jgi:tripartite-type tricarboxylate transporter receptor subunit TctC
MGSSGNGTPQHMGGELFKMLAGVNLVHVPYRGGAPALADLIGGQVQVVFADLSAIEYVRAGTLRALAVTTATRWDTLPDLPAIGEFVPGYELKGWLGVVAPRNTPAAIIDTLNREINAGLADPGMKARLADLGYAPFPSSPAEFGRFLAGDTENWSKVIRFAGIKAE